MKLVEAIKEIYLEKQKFIVIGLAGRTGSGCSTTCSLLNSETFDDFNPPKPKCNGFKNEEERKYAIVYEYLKNNWAKFRCIKMTDVITSFILEKPISDFKKFIKNKNIVLPKLDKGIEEEFSKTQKKVCKYKEKYEKLPESKKHSDFIKLDDLSDLVFVKIPNINKELKKLLEGISSDLYTEIFQQIGNNIRNSGNPYDDGFDPKKIYEFPRRVNLAVKLCRYNAQKNNDSVFIVIDALRNPYEIAFFRDRYSAFYLFAVKTNEKDRRERLIKKKKLSYDNIELLDKTEYNEKLKGKDLFTHLNVKQCVSVADVHLTNSGAEGNDFTELKNQLVKYISLIMHPGLVTPSVDERLMQIAYSAKMNSGCISRQVGAVVADKYNSVKAVGWNTTPAGQVPCLLRNVTSLQGRDDKEAFSHYELNDEEFNRRLNKKYEEDYKSKLKGRNLSFCFKDVENNNICGNCDKIIGNNQVHTRSIHAEEYAFLELVKYGGVGVQGGKLYVTASPCELCSKKSYHLGISEIIYIEPYPGIAERHILRSGENQPIVRLFFGVVGRAYEKLFEPIMPYKDELNLLIGGELSSKEPRRKPKGKPRTPINSLTTGHRLARLAFHV